jgi:hypothetical protein
VVQIKRQKSQNEKFSISIVIKIQLFEIFCFKIKEKTLKKPFVFLKHSKSRLKTLRKVFFFFKKTNFCTTLVFFNLKRSYFELFLLNISENERFAEFSRLQPFFIEKWTRNLFLGNQNALKISSISKHF